MPQLQQSPPSHTQLRQRRSALAKEQRVAAYVVFADKTLVDMARRTLHDEGARELQHRLEGKVKTDFDTARRLFTLVCVLQMRG